MRYVLLLAVMLAGNALAQTGTATLSCTPPTQYTDGSSITGTITYKFYRGTTAGSQTTASPVQSSCNYVWTGLAAGTHYFSSTATVNGIESARSNVASKTIVFTPNPPTNLTVAADNLVAYGSQQSDERQTTYPVGTVAANTPCDGTMSANGLYRVPKTAVTWAGDVRPAVVFAECLPSSGG
jgi:hypothetical protein